MYANIYSFGKYFDNVDLLRIVRRWNRSNMAANLMLPYVVCKCGFRHVLTSVFHDTTKEFLQSLSSVQQFPTVNQVCFSALCGPSTAIVLGSHVWLFEVPYVEKNRYSVRVHNGYLSGKPRIFLK